MRTAQWLAGMILIAAPVAAQVPTPELAGTWRYNAARSDRPEDRLPLDPYGGVTAAASPPRATSDSARPRRMPSRRPGRGASQFGETGLVQALRQPPEELRILLDERSVTLRDETGSVLTLSTDGGKVREENGGLRLERKAQWEGRDLRIEEKANSGGSLRTTYRYDRTLRRLTVLARYSGPRYPESVEVRRVYDRLDDAP